MLSGKCNDFGPKVHTVHTVLPAVINVFGRYTYLCAHQPLNVRTHLERYHHQAE